MLHSRHPKLATLGGEVFRRELSNRILMSGRPRRSGGARRGAGRKPSDINERRRELERLWYSAVTEDEHTAIIRKVVEEAMEGHPWAISMYLDRVLGKPVQPVDIGHEGGALPIVAFIPASVEPEGELPGSTQVVDGEVTPRLAAGDPGPQSLE